MKEYALGIDLGGTTVKFGLFNADGKILDKWEIPTDKSEEGSRIIPDIGKSVNSYLADKMLKKEDFAGIGLDVPGAVDANGLVLTGVNIGWKDVKDAAKELSELTGLPVSCANDANAAALGEQWTGSGENADSLIFVTLGTGVGAGIIFGGRIVCGAHGSAGEMGHTALFPALSEKCGCGNRGCFEQVLSASGMVKTAMKYADEKGITDTARYATPKLIFEAAGEGDETAILTVSAYAAELGRGLAVAGSLLDPELILIGGGIAGAGEELLTPVRESYREHVFLPAKDTPIRLAALGNDAGIAGSARLAFQKFK